jgi:hypothetical protein
MTNGFWTNSMRKSAIILFAVLAMSCVAKAQDAGTVASAANAGSSGDFTIFIAGLNALPSSLIVLPVSSATSMLSATNPVISTGGLAPIIAVAPAPRTAPVPALEGSAKHPFLDKPNLAIFASVAAARTMDPISTWQFRRHGLHESQLTDGFVDNKPLFAAYSASLVAGQVSTSYVFHRLGWHKMERISALIHTAAVTEAVVHNYRIGSSH